MSASPRPAGPRVPPVQPGTRPELQAIEARILAERGAVSPLYQVLLNSPAIASGWEAMLTAVRNRTRVPADLRELIILRVAVLNRAGYEFEAHVPHARAAGLGDAQIAAVRAPDPAPEFASPAREVLQLTDHMTRDVQVPQALMDTLAARLSPQDLLELVATVAAYNMVSRLLVALDIGH